MTALQVPDSSGWWLWHSGGDLDDDPERILVVVEHGHATVADDEEWEEATGETIECDPETGESTSAFEQNYWEGTDCGDKRTMPGVWVKDESQDYQE